MGCLYGVSEPSGELARRCLGMPLLESLSAVWEPCVQGLGVRDVYHRLIEPYKLHFVFASFRELGRSFARQRSKVEIRLSDVECIVAYLAFLE